MAHNLLKNGVNLVVFDLSPDALSLASSRGATIASTVKELASKVSVVITALPSSSHVLDLYMHPETGILANAGDVKHEVFIDCSTIDPAAARKVSGAAHGKGVLMVDAPMSGGVTGAEAGTLTFMVGGSGTSFNMAKPYLEKMGRNVVHCGDAGTGQVVKLCNNLILGVTMGGVAEAMNLGVKLGMDPKILASIINTSSGRCWSSDSYNPCPGVLDHIPSSRNYTGGFGTTLMRKDMRLAAASAQSLNVPLPVGSAALQMYEMIASQEKMDVPGRDKDFSYYYQYVARQHGTDGDAVKK